MKFLLLCLVLLFSTCQQNTAVAPIVAPNFQELSAETVFNKLKEANLPAINEIKYTEETDPNKLLGRPNQYIEKINFDDSRVKESNTKENSIEVFKTQENLNARKNYTESISKAGSVFAQYVYFHKNVLLRLDHKLLPKDAAEYERILKSL